MGDFFAVLFEGSVQRELSCVGLHFPFRGGGQVLAWLWGC